MEAFTSTSARLIAAVLFIVPFATGCVSSTWKKVLLEDNAVAYHQFLREYPDSGHAAEAQEHIDFLTLKRNPTLAGFVEFRERYPKSKLVAGLQKKFEEATFAAARAVGTPQSYEDFVRKFPSGDHAARAEGNAIYLREVVNRPDPDALGRFAAEYPESDFAIEAKRSADVFADRRGQGIASVGLVIETAPDTPEARRVMQALAEHAAETYSRTGTQLVPLSSRNSAAGVDAMLVIEHHEKSVENVMSDGLLAQPGVLATVRVSLTSGDQTIFAREFELRVEKRNHVEGKSVLFGSGGPRFWDHFFVPVATWEANLAVREAVELMGDAVAVDASGDRAVVLFEKGGFQVLQLADPTDPVTLAEYARASQFEAFDGVRVLPNAVAIYGDDGIELIGVASDGSQEVRSHSRGEIGSVSAIENMGDGLIVGSTKGLLAMSLTGEGEIERVVRREIRGVARVADLLVFADVDTLFVSSLPLLREKRVMGQLEIGKLFATERIRVFGTTALVIGEGGVIVVDLRSPRTMRMIGRLRPEQIGRVEDAGRVGSRIFLVGERGVQVLGPKLDRVVDVVDVVPGREIAVFGRHLVTVGGSSLQVIDGLPFGPGPSLAAPAKAMVTAN